MIELMHAVWLTKKIIELVCSGTLAQAAQDYALALNQASQELGPRGTSGRSPAMSSIERRFRREFMEAARREMGYAGEPLLRRTHAEDEHTEATAPATVQP
jgi:hypothetical protein